MKRGEIFLVLWPFSDYSGQKRRPAVVVQADFLNRLISDTVLVQITGSSRKALTEVLLDPAVEKGSGLKHVSFAVCNTILTIDQTLMGRKLGELSATAVRQIETKIKLALELP